MGNDYVTFYAFIKESHRTYHVNLKPFTWTLLKFDGSRVQKYLVNLQEDRKKEY